MERLSPLTDYRQCHLLNTALHYCVGSVTHVATCSINPWKGLLNSCLNSSVGKSSVNMWQRIITAVIYTKLSRFVSQRLSPCSPGPCTVYWICTNVYSRTPLIQFNCDGEPSGYAENPDNWIFLWK